MKNTNFLLLSVFLLLSQISFGQGTLVNIEIKEFQTIDGPTLSGITGYMQVPESRDNPNSRKIKVKFTHLKSLSQTPNAPVVYLEGGGGTSTWQADDPEYLVDWLPLLKISDLIFIDRRDSNNESLTYIWQETFPSDFFISQDAAYTHYQKMSKVALSSFHQSNIDIGAYTVKACANDVGDLMNVLQIKKYSILGFSFGTHIGMAVMRLFPDQIEKSILVGSDGLNQALNYPSYLDQHIDKIAMMVKQDKNLNAKIPDFKKLVERVMEKLEKEPAVVTITNPLTNLEIELPIGPFGLAFILRMDIDDSGDIPVIPRLLYSIDKGDYAMLTWFAQKRMVFGLAVPAASINLQLASGATSERWQKILQEAENSLFDNVVNFPFSAVKDHWLTDNLAFEPIAPLKTNIPTLFITGTLDCRTPEEQVDETMKTFSNAKHIKVVNSGHEQTLWNKRIFDEAIPNFLLNKEIKITKAYYGDIKFLPLEGPSDGHPSIK